MRQDPGEKNALGNIKFIFPNRHAIYLHDTPSRQLFGKNVRSYSSGCIRVEKYLDLAEYVLQDWSRDKIIERTSGGKERRVNLPSQIPVHLLYFTSWADEDGNPQFRTDIYQKDEPLANALGV
jgi:murein L,D-transpeptidase YcbB/YkuD